jgi:hypothetical protein
METNSPLCHIPDMVKRLKRPRDANQLAKLIVDIATGQVEDREPTNGHGKAQASVSADKKPLKRTPRVARPTKKSGS